MYGLSGKVVTFGRDEEVGDEVFFDDFPSAAGLCVVLHAVQSHCVELVFVANQQAVFSELLHVLEAEHLLAFLQLEGITPSSELVDD